MTRKMGLLLGLVVALGALLFFDRMTPPTTLEDTPPRNTEAAAAPVATGQNALNPVATLPPEVFAPIFERPLFRPDRSRTGPTSEETAAQESEVSLEPEKVELVMPPRLLGTVSRPRPGGAFLADGNSGEISYVVIGQSFKGWRLLEIGDDWAELLGETGPLHLSFPKLQQPVQTAP